MSYYKSNITQQFQNDQTTIMFYCLFQENIQKCLYKHHYMHRKFLEPYIRNYEPWFFLGEGIRVWDERRFTFFSLAMVLHCSTFKIIYKNIF